ncbi:uncharacterized protein LOC113797793 [Dermatophagoides pteronyssinus]|uniref:uncharacterized protein LOC113797793 n=1 Tax=Dermatophagoides pteronyssinus TaxID=6956 RepID=UPI003F66D5AF
MTSATKSSCKSSSKSESGSSIIKQFWQNYSLNNLASLWYSLLTTCLQIYLIIRAIYRFSAYISLPWPNNGQAPEESINFYLIFIAISILIVPFFLIVSLMKIGNYSNDGHKIGLFNLGKYHRYLQMDDDNASTLNPTSKWYRTLWKHSLPIGPVLHLLMSLCLLFPRLITDAQLIRHGFRSKSQIWKSDFDFLLKHFDGKIFNFFGLIQTINITEHYQILNEKTSTLGQQFFIRNSKFQKLFAEFEDNQAITPEMLNIFLALLMITIRYPAVFWRCSKTFSLILTFQLVLNSVQCLITINSFEIGYKIFICDPTLMLIRFRESSSLSIGQLSSLTFFYIIILQLSTISLYVYGLSKYREYRLARTKYFQYKYENYLLINLLPYVFAMIFFVIMSGIVGPLFYEYTIIYSGSLNSGALSMLLATIIYFICWILMWILLATKTTWNFYYDDLEFDSISTSTADNNNNNKASLLITNDGKFFKIKDNLATMAIVNFIQTNGFEKCHHLNQQQKHHYQPITMKINGESATTTLKSSLKMNHGTLSKNFRFSSSRNNSNSNGKPYETMEKRINFFVNDNDEESDSDSGEYATFHRLKRTYSFNPNTKQQRNIPSLNQDKSRINLVDKFQMPATTTTANIAYGIMCGGVGEKNVDHISDVSSGFHSDGSLNRHNCSLLMDQDDDNNKNSFENLMEKIANPPMIRSISPLQKTNRIMFTTFKPSSNPNQSSKLIEFTENPDYSKYYLPQQQQQPPV